jgi:uncharacterized protein (DUF302 family)
MFTRIARLVSIVLVCMTAAHMASAVQPGDDGIVKVKSAYSVEESIERIKADIAAKGIVFFMQVDQAQLAANAGIKLRPSTLLVFGNPALGSQFITSKPESGLDWPVRLLVHQDEAGYVWATYTDFGWLARRHGIKDREAQFAIATKVVASITSTVAAK